MKYGVLREYRDWLCGRYSSETARTYYIRLDGLFKGRGAVNPVGQLDVASVIGELSKIRYKNHFSQAKNAFLHFCEFQHITLDQEHLEAIKTLEKNTRKKYRKLRPLVYKDVDSKIKHLENNKLKMSFEAMLNTGLRVGELEQVSPADCTIAGSGISLAFIGKGGNPETVIVSKDDDVKFYERLSGMIQQTKRDKKLFYSAIYLQIEAKKLGFTCHDLRRIFAKLEYRKTKNKDEVREKLRHTSIKTTNIYLRSKIMI